MKSSKIFILALVISFLVNSIILSAPSFADTENTTDTTPSWFANDVKSNYGYYLNDILGYYKSTDGSYDLCLRNAILRFQADQNLSADGSMGPDTLKVLISRLTSSNVNKPIRTDRILTPPTKGKWIAINKTKHTITLYQGSDVIKKYPMACGAPNKPSPTCKCSVANKMVNPAWGGGGYAQPVAGGAPNNPLGKRWIGLSVAGGSSYGMHGNASPYSIGLSVSHGCIRMINSDVLQFYDLVNVGIPIWIGNDSNLRQWGVNQD